MGMIMCDSQIGCPTGFDPLNYIKDESLVEGSASHSEYYTMDVPFE